MGFTEMTEHELQEADGGSFWSFLGAVVGVVALIGVLVAIGTGSLVIGLVAVGALAIGEAANMTYNGGSYGGSVFSQFAAGFNDTINAL